MSSAGMTSGSELELRRTRAPEARAPEARDLDSHPAPRGPIRMERIALVDLLDRVLAGGVVIAGEVTLSIAEVDLVTVSLRALVTSVSALAAPPADRPEPGP